jgi:hypothetical protein
VNGEEAAIEEIVLHFSNHHFKKFILTLKYRKGMLSEKKFESRIN